MRRWTPKLLLSASDFLDVTHQIPAGAHESEHLVKKSRFIARLLPVQSREEVNEAVAQARRDYPDARHHCWAYLLGRPSDARNAGMSDDGEPAGTAGKPILNVLQHGHLGDVLVIVIRYFGGIKLGAGGLVRAYSAATQQVLDAAPSKTLEQWARCHVIAGFATEQAMRHWIDQHGGGIDEVGYSDAVHLQLRVPDVELASLAEFCAAQAMVLRVES